MAKVELEKVSKVFPGGVKAVDDVSLRVEESEFVVLVGPSGCGKSTTLRMIAGLEEISSGTIRIGDRVVNDVPPKDRDIAMVFQNYALYPHMSVYKNMAFGLRLRMLPPLHKRLFQRAESKRIHGEIDQRVRQTARALEIEHLLERKPRELSGGQRQRVAVGRAIVREPAAFLFDEPLSNLDAKLRVATRAELKRLHQRLNTTTIHVTHDQEEAMTLGDRIVVMKDGKVQQFDTPLETYHRPVNRFVAGFIGMPPMNFFHGVLRRIGGKLLFQEGSEKAGGSLTTPESGFTLVVPEPLQDRLARWADRPVVLGIRPEHLSPRAGAAETAQVNVTIQVIEPLGNHMDLYVETALHDRVVARMEADSAVVQGSRLSLYVDLRKVHFFEPGDAGMNLSLSNESAHANA